MSINNTHNIENNLNWKVLSENKRSIPILEQYINPELPYFSKIDIKRLGKNKGNLTNILKNTMLENLHLDVKYLDIVENKQILEKQIGKSFSSILYSVLTNNEFFNLTHEQILIKIKLNVIINSLGYILEIIKNLNLKSYIFNELFEKKLVETIEKNPVILKLLIPESLKKIECLKIFLDIPQKNNKKNMSVIKIIFNYITNIFEYPTYKFNKHLIVLKNSLHYHYNNL